MAETERRQWRVQRSSDDRFQPRTSEAPLAFGLDACAVDQQGQRPVRAAVGNGHGQGLLPPAQSAEIRHRPVGADRILPNDEKAAKEFKKRTLTNPYYARPAWLDHAHRALDGAVADAYGCSDDWRAGRPIAPEILARVQVEACACRGRKAAIVTPRALKARIRPLTEAGPRHRKLEQALRIGVGFSNGCYRSQKQHWMAAGRRPSCRAGRAPLARRIRRRDCQGWRRFVEMEARLWRDDAPGCSRRRNERCETGPRRRRFRRRRGHR